MLFEKLPRVKKKKAKLRCYDYYLSIITNSPAHFQIVRAVTKLFTLCQIRLKLRVFNQYDLTDRKKSRERMVAPTLFLPNTMYKYKINRIYNS